jgi:hypothetical protein
MEIYRIKTSYWDEEDFFLLTDLSVEEINSVIQPMVKHERESEEGEIFINDEYVVALEKKYPNALVQHYVSFETLTY